MESNDDIPIVVQLSNAFGRYCIAKRNIKSGELILSEAPLVVYPRMDEIREDEMAICICCYRQVKNEKTHQCKLCRWPLCTSKCQKSHYKNEECIIFSDNNIQWSRGRASLIYLLRALFLRETDQDKWIKLMSLACNYGAKDSERERLEIEETKMGISFLEKCQFNVSQDEVNKLIKIFGISSFSFGTVAGSLTGNAVYDALYYKSSLFSHSCSPNTEFKETQGFDLGIYTMVDVKKGEHLTLAYGNQYLLKGAKERRISIFNDHSFICQCLRCRDPTELGTFYSSAKCPWCKSGWLSPAVPPKKRHRCNECWNFMAPHVVLKKEKKFVKKARDIGLKPEEVRIEALGRLISKATLIYGLHPNHHLVVRATAQWLSLLEVKHLTATALRKSSLQEAIVNRAEQLKSLYLSFGLHTEASLVNLDAIIATVGSLKI